MHQSNTLLPKQNNDKSKIPPKSAANSKTINKAAWTKSQMRKEKENLDGAINDNPAATKDTAMEKRESVKKNAQREALSDQSRPVR